jgi:flagellar assembly factor FliW
MMQTNQMTSDTEIPVFEILTKISVLMPKGMIGFEGINHYQMTPLFPEKEDLVYWRLTACDFVEDDLGDRNLLCPKAGTLSFILLSLTELKISGVSMEIQHIETCLKPLGVKYEECVLFLVICVETDEKGNLVNITANVKAPVIYHPVTKQGWQIILTEGNYPISLPLMRG